MKRARLTCAGRVARATLMPIAAALLAACGSMAPSYERPPAPVAEAFPTAAPAGGTVASDLAWQGGMFTDARMKQLIALALRNNRDLRIAALNVDQVRARYDVQRAALWPTVGAGLVGTRQPLASGAVNTTYSAGLSVTAYELDLFGRIKSLSNSAQAQIMASDESRKAAQISLVAAVAAAQLAISADDELLALTQRTLTSREESLRLVKLKADLGASSDLDLRQAQSLVENARATLAAQQRQRAQDENSLVLLVGAPLPGDLPSANKLVDTPLGPELAAGLPSDLLTRRPDIRAAEQQLIAANANIGAARAAFFPSITLTGSAGSVSDQLSGLFKSGTFAWSLTGQLLQPLFDAGRNRANLGIAETGRDIAVAQYEKSIQVAFREVADALAGRATLVEQLQAQQAQAEADTARLRLAELRYRNGVASHLEVLDAERSVFATQQATLLVQLAERQNRVALYKALGGGWTGPGR